MTSTVQISSTACGTALTGILNSAQIEPGSAPSYQLCKDIYLYHPLGAKMAESPIQKAQSQQREISVPNSPEEVVRDQFLAEWENLRADDHILNVMKTARMYGIASIAIIVGNQDPKEALDFNKIRSETIAFNVLDPLNTSGSLVLSQDPNAPDYQKPGKEIAIQGVGYHPSRTETILNESPIYIAYTTSAFGYVGRSVYQRALYPLKSFVSSMVTDDMVVRKAGVLIAMIKQPGAIADNLMKRFTSFKRQILKEAQTDNVISISPDEKIETLNMMNIDGAYGMARKDILENIAVSADMPAQFLNSETFAEGFGEGTEDAKAVALYVDRIRVQMRPLYKYFDRICMYRAWTPEFYATVQRRFPEQYKNKSFGDAFYEWCNSFSAIWPNLITEPDSEKIKVEETKYKTVIATFQVLEPIVDPVNKAIISAWLADNLNENKMLFTNPLNLDMTALEAFLEEQKERNDEAADAALDPEGGPDAPKPFGATA